MKKRAALSIAAASILFAWSMGASSASAQANNNSRATQAPDATGTAGGDAGISGAIDQKLMLTPAQRNAIYAEISKDKNAKTASTGFAPVVGTDVPPMIELYALPDDAVAEVPAAKLYKYTMVDNKVVLVDPTKMRVIDVISPGSQPAPQQ